MKAFHYSTVPAEPASNLPGVALRWVMGTNVDAPNFATRIIEVQPGAATEHHQHTWEHEVFVLEGDALVRDATGGETPCGPGTCVYVAPGEVHQFVNAGDGLLRVICIIPNSPAP